ncbi:hypothetical protein CHINAEXTREME_06320 [Halobiforma lacisalsi AJ5]|uniref:SHOCT domain-containing protein n=1 Tax=Natronobacterium lacisalsi AJ5 TaxID=358396 RepID=M0LXH7_NATLA|nr:SHOCT domain-containing protein [Halobiforma lacisalsi]APW97408.1 hypothetical protein CHINAEXTREME_06320 [Halobiforma lacisalsi AJ5]EMA38297.1 hypothetical protein C445_00310 [Halobiforma lacisalsi AJ5]
MDRLGTLLVKGLGVFVLALVVLGVVATIVGIVFSIVATVFSIVVTLAVLGILVLALVGLTSLLRGGSSDSRTAIEADRSLETDATSRGRDPEDRLRERYVSGELSEAEFERELDRVLDEDPTRRDVDTDRSREFDRTRR